MPECLFPHLDVKIRRQKEFHLQVPRILLTIKKLLLRRGCLLAFAIIASCNIVLGDNGFCSCCPRSAVQATMKRRGDRETFFINFLGKSRSRGRCIIHAHVNNNKRLLTSCLLMEAGHRVSHPEMEIHCRFVSPKCLELFARRLINSHDKRMRQTPPPPPDSLLSFLFAFRFIPRRHKFCRHCTLFIFTSFHVKSTEFSSSVHGLAFMQTEKSSLTQ